MLRNNNKKKKREKPFSFSLDSKFFSSLTPDRLMSRSYKKAGKTKGAFSLARVFS